YLSQHKTQLRIIHYGLTNVAGLIAMPVFPRCLRLQPYFLYKRQEKRAYSFREQKNAQKIIVAASCHCRRGYERLFFRS
ncbi:hypothetical protein OYS96_26175, partial [Raoultella ornithinolytica]